MSIFQKRDRHLLFIPPLIIFIDTLVKFVILRLFNFTPYPESASIPVLGDVLQITYVQNYGKFSQMLGESGQEYLPYVIGGVLLITFFVLLYFYANISTLFIRPARPLAKACLLMILGGDISNNLVDRLAHGFIVDYIDIGIGENRFLTLNLADLFIIAAAAGLVVLILFYENKDKKENITP